MLGSRIARTGTVRAISRLSWGFSESTTVGGCRLRPARLSDRLRAGTAASACADRHEHGDPTPEVPGADPAAWFERQLRPRASSGAARLVIQRQDGGRPADRERGLGAGRRRRRLVAASWRTTRGARRRWARTCVNPHERLIKTLRERPNGFDEARTGGMRAHDGRRQVRPSVPAGHGPAAERSAMARTLFKQIVGDPEVHRGVPREQGVQGGGRFWPNSPTGE